MPMGSRNSAPDQSGPLDEVDIDEQARDEQLSISTTAECGHGCTQSLAALMLLQLLLLYMCWPSAVGEVCQRWLP